MNQIVSLYSAVMSGEYEDIVRYCRILGLVETDAEGKERFHFSRQDGSGNDGSPTRGARKDYLKGAVRWYRCKKCGEWVPETAAECPKCGEPFDIRAETREIEITVEIEPFPGAEHIREKLLIAPKTSLRSMVAKLAEAGVIHPGEYDEVGILRAADHEAGASDRSVVTRAWRQYPDYQPGDLVYIKRRLTDAETAMAHLAYIEKTYSDEQLLREYDLTVELHLQKLPPEIKHIRVLGCAGKDGISEALGFYSPEFISYPQTEIPFEDRTIAVDAIALEIGDNPLVITDSLVFSL